MQSPIRWCGSKRWLAKKLAVEIEATNPKLYVEPFLGGGSVALALNSNIPKQLSDSNQVLMDMWGWLKDCPQELISELNFVVGRYGNSQEGYLAARLALNQEKETGTIKRSAALFLYLNARCFNGLWRINSKGGFNVPWGKIVKPSSICLDEALELSAHLKNCELSNKGYAAALCEIKDPSSTAIYIDSPYHQTFTKYTQNDFDEADQILLARLVKILANQGAKIWASNNGTPLIRELYQWANIEEITEQHNVGAKADRRGRKPTLLIRSHT